MTTKAKNIISVFIVKSIIILNISCEKEINYIQFERTYITENKAHITIKGKYNNVTLDDEYELVFTRKHIIYYDSYFILFGDVPRDTIPCKRIEFTLYSQDFNNRIEFDISFSPDYKNINYYYRLCKIYDYNKLLNIFGYNTVVIDVNPSGTIDTKRIEDFPIKEYKVENFEYNDEKGTMKFTMYIHYNSDNTTDYYLNGIINLKFYKQETFYK